MDWQAFYTLIPYLIAPAIPAGVGIFCWRRRGVPGAAPYALAALSQTIILCGYVAEMLSASLGAKIFWDDFQWVWTAILSAAYLAFSLQYTGRKLHRPRLTWGLIIAGCALATLLVFTDTYHGLVRPTAQLIPEEPFSILTYDFTLASWAVLIFMYGLILAGVVHLADVIFRRQRLHRIQARIVLIGTLIPFLASFLAFLDVRLAYQSDPAPLTFTISSLVVAWGLFRHRLFNVIPMARDWVLETMPDAVMVLDGQDCLIDLNPAAEQFLGRAAREIIGHPISQVLTADLKQVAQYLAVDMVKSAEIRMPARQRCFDLSIMPFYDLHRDLKGRLMVLRDITARRDAEEELEQYRSHLEEMVAERTAELQAANERMQVLSGVKDDFIASISHELRTPITSLKLYHHLLAESPDKLPKYLATLHGETERLAKIVDDLLYLSQIEQGDITPIFAAVDLNALVAESVAGRMALAERNGLTLDLSQEAGLPPVQADSALLERVLSTLLINAFSYTPKGGQISIRIFTHECDGKPEVGLSVSDNGPGIPPEELPRLFERFFRGRIALEAGVPGIGLGLAISREIVERHGGRIEAASEGIPGKGAAFTVWLPVSRAG